jgi:predicted Rossmann fold nucleotide-binding protein DprA/Smf involved in DNA uptake
MKKKEDGLAEQLSLMPEGLTGTGRAVIKLLSSDDAAHIDTLMQATQLPITELTSALLGLEMRELIRQLPGKCFVRKL